MMEMLNEITGWLRNVLKKTACKFEFISDSTCCVSQFSALIKFGFPVRPHVRLEDSGADWGPFESSRVWKFFGLNHLEN